MTSRSLTVAPAPEARPSGGQMSCRNPLDRAPSRRRAGAARVDGFWLKRNMPQLWRNYVRATYRSREACAAYFEVTFQTACNWWDGLHAPSSAVYARASLEDGARLNRHMTGGRG